MGESHTAKSPALPLVPYLIDQNAHTILTCSQVDQNAATACLYAFPCCPGSRRIPQNGAGQFGSLSEELAVGWVTCLITGLLFNTGGVGCLISGFSSRHGHAGQSVAVVQLPTIGVGQLLGQLRAV